MNEHTDTVVHPAIAVDCPWCETRAELTERSQIACANCGIVVSVTDPTTPRRQAGSRFEIRARAA
jgi:hypothetical protein